MTANNTADNNDDMLDKVNVEELSQIVHETEKPAAEREEELKAAARKGENKHERMKIDHEAQAAIVADEHNLWTY